MITRYHFYKLSYLSPAKTLNLWFFYRNMEEEIEEVQSKIDGLSMSEEISSNIADFCRLSYLILVACSNLLGYSNKIGL